MWPWKRKGNNRKKEWSDYEEEMVEQENWKGSVCEQSQRKTKKGTKYPSMMENRN